MKNKINGNFILRNGTKVLSVTKTSRGTLFVVTDQPSSFEVYSNGSYYGDWTSANCEYDLIRI